MKAKSSNSEKSLFVERMNEKTAYIRDKIDECTYPGWLSYTFQPNFFLKSVKLEHFPLFATTLKSCDDTSLNALSLSGVNFLISDECLVKQRANNDLVLGYSLGMAFTHRRELFIVNKRDGSIIKNGGAEFFQPDVLGYGKLRDNLIAAADANGVVKIVIPYFDNDKTDYEVVLEALLSISDTEVREREISFLLILANMGPVRSVDNQPYN